MNGNNNIIHFLSASDRVNYGDLLFPLVFKNFVEENNFDFKFYNYGIVKSDLSHFGALPTTSYKQMLKNLKNQGGKLVIGGGEVFFANWNTLYGFINPTFFKYKGYKIIKKLDLAKLLLANNKVDVPFCPAPDELENSQVKLYFSSVGGGYFGGFNKKILLKIEGTLKSAALLSVRDKRSKLNLENRNINSRLVPDSALLMSDYYTKEIFLKKISVNDNFSSTNYIFLQVGKYKGPKFIEKFVTDLKSISLRLKLNVILCPIGKAPGHEDDLILKKMKLLEPDFIYVEPNNIYDIMFLITNASLYLGTSLHGMITAQSFGVPFVCLNKNLGKVSSYIHTWIDESMECLDFDALDKIESIYKEWNCVSINEKTKLQKQMVRNNLNIIFNDA